MVQDTTSQTYGYVTGEVRQLKFKFHRTDNTYIDLDEKGLARGDMAARTAYYNSLYMISAITPNEIRESEGMQKIEEESLDRHYQQLNMQPVDLAAESQKLDNDAKIKALEEPEPMPEPEPIEPEEVEEPEEIEEKEPEDDKGKAQASISAYIPTMLETLNLLVKNEFNAQNLHGKTDKFKTKCLDDPIVMKEHLDKFYIRHEDKLESVINMHLKYLSTVTDREMPEAKALVKEAVNLPKSEGWQDHRADEIASMILKAVTDSDQVVKIGEIVQGEDGQNLILTTNGFKEVDVIPKN
jgi:hypothetical protein